MKNIYVRLFGGLGNQLFIYAFGLAYAKKYNKKLILDNISGFGKHDVYNREFALDVFKKIPKSIFLSENMFLKRIVGNRIFWKLGKTFGFVYKEPDIYNYHEVNTNKKFFEGYWQSYKYFNDYRDLIKKQLNLDSIIGNEYILNKKSEISNHNSVAIGVRLYEEVKNNNMHQVLEKNYYKKAIEIMENKLNNPIYYVFSTDIKKAYEFLNLYIPKNRLNVIEPILDNKGAINDFYLFSQAKNFIISNSTFYWWAAYLGETKESITIAPKEGFFNKDTNLPHWIEI